MITTYLLHPAGDVSEVLARFIERAQAIEPSEGDRPVPGDHPNTSSEPKP